ncbi:hypothetical protein FisN_7Lh214 [Fistulifera solaris]|uniref:Uncharacterized protein n=1 Tax=Fistulifera solaris TaxID=1519565 RepID=A0A1Z5JRV8_FISSO|nr:hypothetical protein FisN_7Lh214 [Fistulifera solaris]|eukprot:GAX16498.1 hypothetical protein FisN_7Lh214 [Fistulifera solaris]
MEHHPDTMSKKDEESMANSRDIFIAAREAFEQIVEGPNGSAILRSEADKDSDDFEDWFKQETGHDLPFMDAATMKEVAKMTETVGGGLDRDGGMWTLARMVTNSVKSGGDARDVLRLEAGDGVGNGIDGVLRRRRRRISRVMSEVRKRRRDESRSDNFVAKVRIAPIYFGCTSDVVDKGLTLSLPCTLGRRNLVELWWKYCPQACHAERPESTPCERYCSPVRRKSHRELLSREILTIDASGNVDLHAKHSEIILWLHGGVHFTSMKRLDCGESYVMMIGDFLKQPEEPWMKFNIGMRPVVTPDRSSVVIGDEGHVSQTRRRLFHSDKGGEDSLEFIMDGIASNEKSYRRPCAHDQNSFITNHKTRVTMQLRQSPSSSIDQSGSSGGDKLDTQEEEDAFNAQRSLITPHNQFKTKDTLDSSWRTNIKPPLQPCQLFISDLADNDLRTSPTPSNGSLPLDISSQSNIQSQGSALCLPRGETQSTRDERMLCYSESPLVERKEPPAVPVTGMCRDWTIDDWVKLSHQNLASKFGRRMVDLVLFRHQDDGGNLRLPALIDDATIGMQFNLRSEH